MLLPALSLCLSLAGIGAIAPDLPPDAPRGFSALDDVFREVEELAQDTQRRLQEADNESSSSSAPYSPELPSNYHNESSFDTMVGNQSFHIVEKVDKVTDGKTGETHFSRTIIRSRGSESSDIGCDSDADCGKDRYCLNVSQQSWCQPCKELHMSCTKDKECCRGHLCVWGQCTQNATKGEAGNICQSQSDCRFDLCCAIHKALRLPLCTYKLMEHERCYNPVVSLVDLLPGTEETEGPREHCPCAGDLQCQHQGRGSLCLNGQTSSEEDLADTLYSEIDYIV
ncbi:dickkopf-related protein 3a [Denticeps clupeoides]|uniref:Dickkopf N-terminal cysteine-rich domain-containing protein n=1 Tax=Denticeps clupeoides TaxID=299321 RepID=A0AAY4BAH2_9TELE|nr:dickkopf-related protein 3 [Denticeps clupeoides]